MITTNYTYVRSQLYQIKYNTSTPNDFQLMLSYFYDFCHIRSDGCHHKFKRHASHCKRGGNLGAGPRGGDNNNILDQANNFPKKEKTDQSEDIHASTHYSACYICTPT